MTKGHGTGRHNHGTGTVGQDLIKRLGNEQSIDGDLKFRSLKSFEFSKLGAPTSSVLA